MKLVIILFILTDVFSNIASRLLDVNFYLLKEFVLAICLYTWVIHTVLSKKFKRIDALYLGAGMAYSFYIFYDILIFSGYHSVILISMLTAFLIAWSLRGTND